MRHLLRLFALLVIAVSALLIDAARVLQGPLRLDGERTLLLEPGTSAALLVQRLAQDGWLDAQPRSTWYLRAYTRLSGAATQLKAGEYAVPAQTSPLELLELIVSGQTILHELRLIEGWTFRQALAAVRAHPQLRQTLESAEGPAVMAAIGRAGQHPEGRLFPDTYRFSRGMTDVAFLRRAAETMDRVLAEEWAARAEDLPYAMPDEALVMASIIEKETGVEHERGQIAGVFVRRLRLGMRLQTDPTVIYGLGERFDGNLRRHHLLTDGEYNTYTRSGLPPTPICLPGRASLRAALNPAPGKTLYFVARGDGTHEFSETLEAHNAAVRRYQLGR
ncbi:endolytic transglycosylase MltG [Sinimarinibacterium thermocellulolyticum]|uniref:Endolytic murein transglycosylase n=1 Tax=Sinimarinibacterium thermocellulolyticum TaxID=3170016 RepID=A0ABV2AD12_9GAMM